jgi:hypothetical protein
MHYMTRRSHRMQKHKFGVMCPNAFFIKSVPVPPKHEKYCTTVSGPRSTRLHYVTHISHKMQKHKFNVTCAGKLFKETDGDP